MPFPGTTPEQADLIDKCKQEVMRQGHDESSAIAICEASIVKGEPFPDGITFDLSAIKVGARNRAEDKQHIQDIRAAAKGIIDHTMAMEPDTMPEDMHHGSQPVKLDMIIELAEDVRQWVTVKAGAEDWTLDVLGVPFGGPFNGKDHDKQFFDLASNTYRQFYKTIPAVYGHGAQPNGQRSTKPSVIGTATYDHTDAQGHWYKVILDKASELAKRIWEAAKLGKARASSGSLAHMVRYSKNGHIDEWPVAEMTLVDEGTSNMRAANPYAIATPAMKASYDQAGLELPNEQQAEAAGRNVPAPDKQPIKTQGVIDMTDEIKDEVAKAVAAALASEREAAAKLAEAARIKSIEDENTALKAEAAKGRRLPGGVHVTQFADTSKYDYLSTADLALAIDVQNNIAATGKMPRASLSAMKALALKVARIENDKVSPETAIYAKAGFAPAFGDLSDEAIKGATDPAYSTLSGFGDKFVGTAYSSQIWELLRAQCKVAARIPSVVIPDGYSSEYFPIEGADPTWYKVAETTAADSTMGIPVAKVTASQMATANKQITVAKMGARAMYTGELVEDSIISYVPQLRGQLVKSGAEMMEMVLVDGDTAVSSNINDIGGTTYSGAATSLFLLTNGLRKSPLVTTTGQSRSAAGGFVAEDFLYTLKLLGSNGLGYADPTKCGLIVDPNTWFATAALPEAKDKNQTVFQFDGGNVTRAYLVEVIPSWFMHYASATRKANTAGKVDQDTAANNAYGAILGVRFDQWKIAYKRMMTMETTRFANSDTWEIVALTRWGLGQRDTLASSETYYVGI